MNLVSKIRGNKLFKSGLNYSLFGTLSTVCTMVIGFLNMKWLGPELLGLWQSLCVINLYTVFLQLGIQSGLNLELPLALGEKNKEKELNLVSTAFAFAILISLVLIIFTISVLFFLICNGYGLDVICGFGVVALIAIFSCFRLHYIATFRSANAFDKLTRIYKYEIITKLILIFFIYKYQYFGLLFYHVGIEAIFLLGLYIFSPYKGIKPSFHKKEFSILFKRGLFMTIFNQIKNVTASSPTLILLYLGGVLSVGYFNPALTLKSVVNLVPTQIAQFLHPQLAYKYGQSKKAKDMWNYFKTLAWVVPICLLPFVIIGIILCPYFISTFFPKYSESIMPICILLIGFMFSTTFFSRGFLITIRAYKLVIILEVLDLILFVGLPCIFILLGYYPVLISMALGLTSAYIISYIINIFMTKRELFKEKYN